MEQRTCGPCGGSLTRKGNYYVCDFCGNRTEIDMGDDIHAVDRANAWAALRDGDFEKAADLFEEIIVKEANNHEAYWGRALAISGIVYVTDMNEHKKVPTCNNITENSFFKNADVQKAISLAPADIAENYKQQAAYIDKVRLEWLEKASKEPAYDIFISFKDSDRENGIERTNDSINAQELYTYLVEKGYKVFFSRVSLRGKISEQYEPYIYNAIKTAKVMIVYGEKPEYFRAPWVKNEWGRFKNRIASGEKENNSLVVVYKNMDPGQLPVVLKSRQCMNYDALTFSEDLTKHIDRVIAAVKKKAAPPKPAPAPKPVYTPPPAPKPVYTPPPAPKPAPTTYTPPVNNSGKKKSGGVIGCLLFIAVAIGLLSLIISGISSCAKKNGQNSDLYTPALVKMYAGTYVTSGDEAEAVLTITSCSESGALEGYFEFYKEEDYGKYSVTGQITSKKNNGKIEFYLEGNEWLVQPGYYSFLSKMTIKTSGNCEELEGSDYSLKLSAGAAEKYSIKTTDDLRKLEKAKGTYTLQADLDMSGVEWTPISGFGGSLNGNGHTIKNLTINGSGDNVGLFDTLSGSVTNLKIENAEVSVSGRQQNVGILCGSLSGSLTDVSVSGTVDADTGTNVGGIAGYVTGLPKTSQFSNLSSAATVNGLESVGGLFGAVYVSNTSDCSISMTKLENTGAVTGENKVAGITGSFFVESAYSSSCVATITDTANAGAITGELYVGGIFGHATTDSTESKILSCTNNAAIEADAVAGCIAGYASWLMIEDCNNEGSSLTATGHYSEEGEKLGYIGGYVGHGSLVTDCTNHVEINYTGGGKYVGGIAGRITFLDNGATLDSLSNEAAISGADCVGGLIGEIYVSDGSDRTLNFSDSSNSGAVSGANRVSGILGNLFLEASYSSTYTAYLSDLKNTGAVSGETYVGGIVGCGNTDSEQSYIIDASNSGAISAKAVAGCIGGELVWIMVKSSTNEGATLEVTGAITQDGTSIAYVGGYVGHGSAVVDCTNYVDISYTGGGNYVGGIVGRMEYIVDGAILEELHNQANISGANYVGGLIGDIYASQGSDGTFSFNDSSNSGTVSGKSYVSGILGNLFLEASYSSTYTAYMENLTNTGSVSGNQYVGGVIGYGKTDSDRSAMTDCTTSSGSLTGKIEGINKN